MAIIYSYPQGSSALQDDRLIITRIDEEENEITTKQLTLGQVADYIIETSPVVSGTGTPNYFPIWGPEDSSIIDSQLKQIGPSENGLYQIKLENTDRFIINKPSSITSGDPEYLIQQDDEYKVSFGWDDDGGGFAYLYNWSGAGIKFGSAGNNPMIEIKTTSGEEEVDIHKSIKFVDYGSGNKTGVGAQILSVDASGNVIETSGTPNKLPIWLSSGGIGDSIIYEDDNGNIGIGTLTPGTNKLKVDGTSEFTGQVTILETPLANTDAASKGYVDAQVTGKASGVGTTNAIPLWSDGPNGVISDSVISQESNSTGVSIVLPTITSGAELFSITALGESKLKIKQNFTSGNPSPAFEFGKNSIASNNGSVAMGVDVVASGAYAFAAGMQTVASNTSSFAVGSTTIASGIRSVAIGHSTTASGKNSVSMGVSTEALGNNSVAMGNRNVVSGNDSLVMGSNSIASGNNSMAIGNGATASGLNSVALGTSSASADNTYSIGRDNNVAGNNSAAVGLMNITNNNNTYLFGRGLTTGQINQVLIGHYPVVSSEFQSYVAIGVGTNDINRATAMSFKRQTGGSQLAQIFAEALFNALSFADDTAAAAGGVEVGQLYRNGSDIKIRMT